MLAGPPAGTAFVTKEVEMVGMARVGLVALAAGLTFLDAAPAAAESKEVLLGISTDFDKGELTIEVASGGCTKKKDFRFELKAGVLTVLRKERDACKAMPSKIRLAYRLAEVGIDANKPFGIANLIIVNENLAGVTRSSPRSGAATVHRRMNPAQDVARAR